jgi:hypothetical protein
MTRNRGWFIKKWIRNLNLNPWTASVCDTCEEKLLFQYHTKYRCREETWVMVNTFKVDQARGTV